MNDHSLIREEIPEPVGDVESTIDQFRSEYFGTLQSEGEFSSMRSEIHEKFDKHPFEASDSEIEGANRMMKLAILASVTSIRTNTQKWESLMVSYLNGDQSESEFAQKCRDGNIKAEKIEHVFNSDIPSRARRALWLGDVDLARRTLTGLETDGDVDETYLRTTKASFVTYLLGYDTVCMDHRNHSAMEPIIRTVLEATPYRPGGTNDISRQANRKARSPTDVEFWHESLKWSPSEYDELAGAVVDYIDDHTEIPRDRIPQVTFNVGGNGRTTTHETLMSVLSG